MDRYRVSPAVQALDLLTEKMKCLQQLDSTDKTGDPNMTKFTDEAAVRKRAGIISARRSPLAPG